MKSGFASRSLNALNFGTLPYHSRSGTPAHARNLSRGILGGSRPESPTAMTMADEFGLHEGTDTDTDCGGQMTSRQIKGKSRVRTLSGWFSRDNSLMTDSETEPNTPRTPRSPRRRGSRDKNRVRALSGWFSRDNSLMTDSEPTTPHRNGTGDSDSPLHQYPPSMAPSRQGSSDNGYESKGILHAAATRVARTLKTAVLHDARNLEGRENSNLSGLVWGVSSPYEAKRLARSIFKAFRNPSRNYLIPRDFLPAFHKMEDAERAFNVFDSDGNGDLTRGEIKTTLIMIYRERRSLSRSMRDVSQALESLNKIMLFFAMAVLLFISLSIFNINVGNSLTSLYTLGIGLSFIFKNSASNAFDAVVFLFVTQ